MPSLKTLSQKVPSDRVAFVFPNRAVTYGKLRQLTLDNSAKLQQLKGCNIVLHGCSRQDLIILLYFLDGVANSILLLPYDIAKEGSQLFLEQAEIDYSVFLSENFNINIEPISGSAEISNQKSDSKNETSWIIPTSGTTNTPKLVSHNVLSLTRTVKSDIKIAQNYSWGLIYDVFRFAGIQVFLQSFISGSTLIVSEPEMSLADALAFFTKHNCNTLSATPSFWRKALMTPQSKALSLKNITLGGEISDNAILMLLKKQFPEAKIRHIYASTEVGVGFSVVDGEAGFPKSFLTDDLPNVSLKIDGNGLLWIKPKNSSQHYLSGQTMFEEEGYINTGDLVEVTDSRVYFLGRESGAINVGGNKVQPEEVERCILASGMVSQAYVYAKKNPVMGSLVFADIVLTHELDKKVAKDRVLHHCKDRLANYKVPAMIRIVDEIKTTVSGKVKRENV